MKAFDIVKSITKNPLIKGIFYPSDDFYQTLPPTYLFLIDNDGNFLIDNDGFYLIVELP